MTPAPPRCIIYTVIEHHIQKYGIPKAERGKEKTMTTTFETDKAKVSIWAKDENLAMQVVATIADTWRLFNMLYESENLIKQTAKVMRKILENETDAKFTVLQGKRYTDENLYIELRSNDIFLTFETTDR